MRIKKGRASNYYKRAKQLLSQPPLKDVRGPHVGDTVVRQYHLLINQAKDNLEKRYNCHKLPETCRHNQGPSYQPKYGWDIIPLRAKIAEFIGGLESEYDLDKPDFWEEFKKWVLSFLSKLTWQIILWLLGFFGAIIAAYLIAKFNLN